MIKVGVKNSTGSATEQGEMTDAGIIFFASGVVSTVSAEVSNGKTVFVITEEKLPEPLVASVPRSDKPVKPKKKG